MLDPAAAAPSPASMDPTLAVMREVLSKRFGIADPDLSLERELASLGLDSLAFIEYSFELEKDLHIVLPDLPRDMVTVGDLARFVHGEVEKQAQGKAAKKSAAVQPTAETTPMPVTATRRGPGFTSRLCPGPVFPLPRGRSARGRRR